MGSKARKARAKFDKIKALNGAEDQGAARKEKLRMASSWGNRGDLAGDFHKPKNMGGRQLSTGRNRSHLVTSL